MPTAHLATGVDLYFESHGQGEPLVLIPATGFSGEVWRDAQVPALADSLQVVVFDPRGCGRSSPAAGVYTIERMAADVVALLDHLSLDAAHVVGHSMGGRIGLAMALDYPGRVRSLILAASGSGPAARGGDECVPGLPYRLVHDLVAMGFDEYVRHEVVESSTYFTPEYRARYPERVQAFFELAWPTHARWPEYLRLCMARHTWEGTHRLGEVGVPTMILIGDEDVVGSNHVSQARTLIERIPGAEARTFAGQSHGFFWQAPEETNALLRDWVERHAYART